MAVTVKDVAAIAGVSTATVSRVINNEEGIRPATRERVQKAIKKSGYKVNAIARSLKTSRSGTVGLITPEFTNDFFMNIAQGVEEYLEGHGYTLIISSSNESVAGEKRRAALLAEKSVEGVIVIPSTGKGSHFKVLSKDGIPVAFADRSTEDFPADTVMVDNRKGSCDAVSYLIKQGFRKIAFIGGSPDLSNAKERLEGYLKALEEHGIEADPDLVLTGNFHVDSGYLLMERLMQSNTPPDHVFIANYFMHAGAVKYLVAHGYKPLHSPGISSFDDMGLSSILGYTSVTVSQPMREIGKQAARLLLNRIQENRSSETIRKKYRIIRLKTSLKIYRGD